ncbi:MAG: nicotinate phosphoribosyltransferase [Bacillota bacterium]|nr:nicotinate phosphoribosyltransferase [Bacillota bacterium]
MSEKRLDKLEEVRALHVPAGRRLFSAEHAEILAGKTTDVYFIRTLEILRALGLDQTPVTAEVFARAGGLLCGLEEAVNFLSDLPVEVEALPEGARFEPKEVVMRIRGPYGAFATAETIILGMLASSSGWATAAAECRAAAGPRPMICFGSRHVHPAVAPVMERAAVIGGCDGASNILAAKLLGKEPSGTVPHAVFLIVGDTVKVAEAYHRLMPPDAPRIILIDTFKDEAEEALRVAEALGPALSGIRLDTPGERGGVTPDLVREVRYRLDQAGHRSVKIFISGGLTPERIQLLAEAGADAFGVGSYISGAPPIDFTMDLKVVNGRPVAKRGRLPGELPNPRLVKRLPR